MPRDPGGPATAPLSDPDQESLNRWLPGALARTGRELQDARIVAVFYTTGIHPVCLANPDRYQLRSDGAYAFWLRAKTRRPIASGRGFPLPPVIQPWFASWIQELPSVQAWWYRDRVHRAGQLWVGNPRIGPNNLRHTAIWRCLRKYGVDVTLDLFEVSPGILIRYARRIASESARSQIATEGFGIDLRLVRPLESFA